MSSDRDRRLAESLARMTVANGCTEAEAATAAQKLAEVRARLAVGRGPDRRTKVDGRYSVPPDGFGFEQFFVGTAGRRSRSAADIARELYPLVPGEVCETWQQKDGRVVAIRSMGDAHIRNAIAYADRELSVLERQWKSSHNPGHIEAYARWYRKLTGSRRSMRLELERREGWTVDPSGDPFKD